MALITKAIKGTKDVLPKEVYKNQYIEQTCLSVAENFGYKEIRTPVFEHTELFQRGVGDTTDVVQKEMYTFNDKGNRRADAQLHCAPRVLQALPVLFWKTDFATRHCRKRFAISHRVIDTKSHRQADCANSTNSVLSVSVQQLRLQMRK